VFTTRYGLGLSIKQSALRLYRVKTVAVTFSD
jgi:hypothetical protein